MSLNLIELFASIQGETSYTGLPTTFIRLAACNLRCSWCDTTYSFGRGEPHSLEDIYAKVHAYGCKYVCVTGGEPLLQKNVYPFLKELCEQKYHVSLETSGSISIEQVDPRVKTILDIKCPGSEMAYKNLWSNLALLKPIDEIKFVLLHREDYDWMKDICHKYQLFGKPSAILVSPVWGKIPPQTLIQWILEDKLPVRLNLQIHKYIWLPETQGV